MNLFFYCHPRVLISPLNKNILKLLSWKIIREALVPLKIYSYILVHFCDVQKGYINYIIIHLKMD